MPYKSGFGPFAPEIYRAPMSYPYRDGLIDKEWATNGELAAERALTVIDKQIGAANLAAVIIEPVQGEGGFIVPAPGLPARAARRGAPTTTWCSSPMRCRAGSPAPARCSPARTRASNRT